MNNTNEIKELSIRYGVPIPDTCKQLDWKEPTLLCWVYQQPYDGYTSDFWKCTLVSWAVESGNDYILAPQMHEIAIFLPIYIVYKTKNTIRKFYPDKKNEAFINIYTNPETSVSHLSYANILNGATPLYQNITNNHFAEAYAQMYLKLKQANLLNND